MRRWSRSDHFAAIWIVAGALAAVAGILGRRAVGREGIPSPDVYGYSYPLFVYAQTAIQQGHGLLWNDLLNCGQPFFGIISTSLIYPFNFVFLPFDPRIWLFGQALLNLLVAGLGAYLLGRVIGLGRMASLGGALAFELGGISLGLASWFPPAQASYVWMPAALACTERILRSPSRVAGVALAAVLTLQLLAGYPQNSVYTYLLIGLRAAYELATRVRWNRWRSIRILLIGMLLPLALGAIQLAPMAYVLLDSVRGLPMTPEQILVGQPEPTWAWFRERLGTRSPQSGTPAGLLPALSVVLAGAAVGTRGVGRIASFHLLLGVVCVLLIFDTPLRDLYRQIPLAGALRVPHRSAWITSFSLSVLVAIGLEALCSGRSPGQVRGWPLALAGALAAAVFFSALLPQGLAPREWALVASLLSLVALGAVVGESNGARFQRIAIPLLAVDLIAFGWAPFLGFLSDEGPLRRSAAVFEHVREHATPQHRVYLIPRSRGFLNDLSVSPKVPTFFGLSAIVDYEHLTSRRFAELYVRMTTGKVPQSAGEWINGRSAMPRSRAIFDLMAARWVVGHGAQPRFEPPLELAWSPSEVRAWENPRALPRAFYVPAARVVSDAEERLAWLASRSHDPRNLALLDEHPLDGYLGSPGGRGYAAIEQARSETLVVRVDATRAGFLFLSDQYDPGWSASVDGSPTPVLRANHAFRLVRVPKGTSTVTFRYRPRGLLAGALVSVLSAAATATWLAQGWRRG